MRGSPVFFVMRAFSLVPHFLVCAWRGGKDVPHELIFKSHQFLRGRGKGALYPRSSTMSSGCGKEEESPYGCAGALCWMPQAALRSLTAIQ
jgi:hypothetical protein